MPRAGAVLPALSWLFSTLSSFVPMILMKFPVILVLII
jgi:hypothetical protein